jgi:hypothetical protein
LINGGQVVPAGWKIKSVRISNFLEQASRHHYLGLLERDMTPVAGDLGADLQQLRSQRSV